MAAATEKTIFLDEPKELSKECADSVAPKEEKDNKEYLWYLAYGSNMCSDVLTKRRGIKPVESLACTCDSLYLSFDLRSSFLYVEPTFASVLDVPTPDKMKKLTLEDVNFYRRRTLLGPIDAKDIGTEDLANFLPKTLHGVVHKITKGDYETIRRTEGGGGHDEFGYRDKEVECIAYDGTKIKAKTLVANQYLLYPDAQPSLRYLNILRKGGREHGVKQEYLDYLDSMQHYECKTFLSKVGKYVMFILLLPVILFFMFAFVGVRAIGYKGQLPWVLYWFLDKLSLSILYFHDVIYSKIFGNGSYNPITSSSKLKLKN